MRNRQRGMTFWGMSFVVGALAFAVFLSFKTIPIYSNDFTIKAALVSLAKNPNVGAMSKQEMIETLAKRMALEYTEMPDPTKHLHVEKRGRNQVIRYSYESVIPLFFNVSLLLDFEHIHEVSSVE